MSERLPLSPEQDPVNPEESVALSPAEQRQRLWELAIAFLKLGTTAFGGPAAHIAMMDDEMVSRRRWLSREKLLDLIGISNLIPGPSSTELAIHIGYERAGWPGLMVAGCSFILPAMLMVWGFAALYVQFETLPQVKDMLYGIKPVIIAVVVQALWKLGQKAIKDRGTAIAAGLAILLALMGMDEVVLLLLAGGLLVALNHLRISITWAWFLPSPDLLLQVSPAVDKSWLKLFLIFLKIGSVLYGSGYVLLAFLQRELVDKAGLISADQLLDAVAVGQLTPGPLFTTATFIGYVIAGNAGAIAATFGIFLPAFILVALINPWVERLRQSWWVGSFLDGVNAASLGLMAIVAWRLGSDALVDGWTVAIGLLSLVFLLGFKVNSAWLVVMGGAAGWLVAAFL